jgi:HSP20 family protein
MQEEMKIQQIPVKMYRANGRLTVVTPMPGLEAENILVEITPENHLLLEGMVRGRLKGEEGKELLMDEWSVGDYFRDLELPNQVNGEQAHLSYGNGVLAVSLLIVQQTIPARIAMSKIGDTRGEAH